MSKKPEKVTVSSQRRLLLPVAAVVALSVIIVSVIWAIALSGDKNNNSPEAPAQPTVTITPETGGKLVKGNTPRGTVEENQKQVLAASQELLNQAYEAALKDGDFSENSKKILAGDYSSLPKKYQDTYFFTSLFENDQELQNISYVLVAQLAKTIIDTYGADSIQPLFADAHENVYMDIQGGVAHVPFGLFAGDQATFSLEWVFVDGEWRFSPYTLVDAVQTAQQASGGLEDQAK